MIFLCAGMIYEKAAASRFRTRMTRIARIFTDMRASVFCEQYVFYRIYSYAKICEICDDFSQDNPRVSASSAQSAFHRRLSAFICVHLRLISVSLSDRAQKIKGEYLMDFAFPQFEHPLVLIAYQPPDPCRDCIISGEVFRNGSYFHGLLS